MVRSLVVVWSLAAVVVLAVFPEPLDGATKTGLHGLVVRSPSTPVCVAEKPCSAPVPHAMIRFARGGVLKIATTNATGRYSIALAAGRYVVTMPAARFGLRPGTVTVVNGKMATANFVIETGIR